MKNKGKFLELLILYETVHNLGNSECKTIGNLHPKGMHYLTCSFQDIEDYIAKHLDFWTEDNRFERSPS